jgi:hypothetical protein
LKISLDKGLDNYIQNPIMVIANYNLKFKKELQLLKPHKKRKETKNFKRMY